MVNLEDEIALALVNSKRVMREARIVVKDLARIRDNLQNGQSEEDKPNDKHRHYSNI